MLSNFSVYVDKVEEVLSRFACIDQTKLTNHSLALARRNLRGKDLKFWYKKDSSMYCIYIIPVASRYFRTLIPTSVGSFSRSQLLISVDCFNRCKISENAELVYKCTIFFHRLCSIFYWWKYDGCMIISRIKCLKYMFHNRSAIIFDHLNIISSTHYPISII